jgi:NAD(P)-dependent dehydrogenase (short-subunit alcohol dehydrogenase family)
MSKIAIVAPIDGPIGAEIIDRLLRSNWSVVAGHISDDFDGDISDYNDTCVVQKWDPRSFISGRNLILEALNRFGSIDASVLISENEYPGEALHETSPTSIQTYIESTVLGISLLARELLSSFIKQGSGRLSLVNYAPDDRPSSTLGSIVSASISALGESLLGVYGNESLAIDVFESKKSDSTGFAEFVLSVESRATDGKTHRFGAGRFPRLTLRGR